MKKLLLKPLRWLIRKLRYYIYLEVSDYEQEMEAQAKQLQINGTRSQDQQIQWPEGKIHITVPLAVSLGKRISFGPGLYLQSDGGVKIGDDCRFGRDVRILTTGFGSSEWHKPVRIGRNVTVGNLVTILPGAKIGDNTIIDAGCTVSGYIAANSYINYQAAADETTASGQVYPHSETSVASEAGEGLIFVASTGRSGSTTIAKVLNQHPDILALHEPKGELIRIAAEYAHRVKSREEVKQELTELFLPLPQNPKPYYVESDQKISNLIDILTEIFPAARFIWLIRNARKVITSTYSRGMFHDIEYDFADPAAVAPKKYFTGGEYARYRLDGSKIKGGFSGDQWRQMTAFERNCWYWSYINTIIEEQLNRLPAERWALIRLENLEEDLAIALRKFGISIPAGFSFRFEKTNKARYELKKEWNAEEEAIFKRYTKSLSDRIYKGEL